MKAEVVGKQKYIENLKVGDLVAFRLYENDAKNFSGKVIKIGVTHVEIETKNGKKFFIEKTNITWINTNGRWPRHIITALRGIDNERIEVDNEEENTKITGDNER